MSCRSPYEIQVIYGIDIIKKFSVAVLLMRFFLPLHPPPRFLSVAVLLMRFLAGSMKVTEDLFKSCRSPYEIPKRDESRGKKLFRSVLPFSLWDSYDIAIDWLRECRVGCRSPYEIRRAWGSQLCTGRFSVAVLLMRFLIILVLLVMLRLCCRSPYEILNFYVWCYWHDV